MALGILPFAAGLALIVPILVAAWTGGELTGTTWKALLSSCGLALGVRALLGRPPQGTSSLRPARTQSFFPLALALTVLAGMGIWNLQTGWTLSEGPPNFGWDAYQMWILRAKVLAQSEVFPTEFWSEPLIARSQWQYPLFLPAFLAWFIEWGTGVRQLAAPMGVLAATLPLATFSLLARSLPPLLAAALALAPFAAPRLLAMHYQVWADPLLVVTVVAGCSSAVIAVLKMDRALVVAAGLVLAAIVSVKNEGVLWVAAIASAATLLMLRDRRSWKELGRTLLALLAPSICFFVSWSLTCRHLGLANTIQIDWSAAPSRIDVIAASLARSLSRPEYLYPLVACLVALGFVIPGSAKQRTASALSLLSVPILYSLVILSVYAVIFIPPPYGIEWLMNTSLPRLTMGLIPTLLCLTIAATTLRTRSH